MRLHRSFFEIQGAFAERVAAILGISVPEALRQYTTFYWVARDNDAGRPPEQWNFDADHADWVAFVEAMDDGADPVEYVYQRHLASIHADRPVRCFEYNYWPEFGWVRLHFGNSPDGLGLKPQSIPDRLAELRQIFVDVATRHPDAVAVRGCSWLYHVPTYRSLFPSMYIDGLASAGYLHQFAALWGQFLDRHGKVKEALRETFIRDIGIARSLCDLNLVFPRDVLATTCPIGIFYRHFGVE